MNYAVFQKNQAPKFWRKFCQILTDFKNSFTDEIHSVPKNQANILLWNILTNVSEAKGGHFEHLIK